jgi:NitT/TauT family transport system substrate-binding protein
MKLLRSFIASLTLLYTALGVANSLPEVKLAALKFGTVKWELETIKRLQLDHKHGFDLTIVDVAGKQASTLSIQNDAVDVIVTDWIWVANQRTEGKNYQFIPYSKAVGSLMVGPDSAITTLNDLQGKRIGIAGGPVDKSWIVIQAIAKKRYGIDLAAQNELVFGAPPLLFKQALSGEIDAVINFWHFLAKLEAKGFQRVVDVQDAAVELGLSSDTPLLGYVFKESWVLKHRALAEGLRQASQEAKQILIADNAAWEPLKPLIKAKTANEFETLRAAWKQGAPSDSFDFQSAQAMFDLMRIYGDGKLIKKDTVLDRGAFFAISE